MNNNKMESNGAIWKGTTKTGLEKLSIVITLGEQKYNLVALPNNFKTADNQPDYRVFLSQMGQNNDQPKQEEPRQKTEEVEEVEEVDVDNEPDDIPF